jgi:hypothetical protein
MKKKNTKHLLLNSLINTDFFILKNNYFFKNFNLFNLLKLQKKAFLHLLNPLELIINFKQFIRIIYFFKKQNSSIFNFFVQENHEQTIIHNFINLNKVNLKYKVFFKFLVLKKEKKTSQFLIFLKENFYKQQRFSQTILNKKVYFVQEINTNVTKNNLGSYKMFNKILDYKKLILLLVFIQQV